MGASAPILEAAHSAIWLGCQLSRITPRALHHPFRTTRLEAASDADAGQVRSLAINNRKSYAAGVCAHQIPPRKTHQRLRVGMKRLAKNILCPRLFDNPPRIHNDHPISKSGENGWIMADHQERGTIALTNSR